MNKALKILFILSLINLFPSLACRLNATPSNSDKRITKEGQNLIKKAKSGDKDAMCDLAYYYKYGCFGLKKDSTQTF